MTVGRLKHEIGARELNGWARYFAEKQAATEAATATPPTGPTKRGRTYSTGNIMAMDPAAAIAAFTGGGR